MQFAVTICRDDRDQYGVGALSVRELRALRRELSIGLGMSPSGSGGRRSADLHLAAVESELRQREPLERAYPARENQVARARRAIAAFLAGSPVTENAVLIVSELVTNSVVHSLSRDGGKCTLRAELLRGFIWLEVEDMGGPWQRIRDDREGSHGLDIVAALCGRDPMGRLNMGIVNLPLGGRVVWARVPA